MLTNPNIYIYLTASTSFHRDLNNTFWFWGFTRCVDEFCRRLFRSQFVPASGQDCNKMVIAISVPDLKMESTTSSETSLANLIHTSCETPKTKSNTNI